MARQNDDHQFRAQEALTSIHEARRRADQAIDRLIEAHQTNASKQEHKQARQDVHIEVMAYYNRLRPYLHHVQEYAYQEPLHLEFKENEDGEKVAVTTEVEAEDGETKEAQQGIYGLISLDNWRLANTTVNQKKRRHGKPDAEEQATRPVMLPPDIAIAAYDLMNEALVELKFGAEPGSDVPLTDLDDAPDDHEFDQPEFDKPTQQPQD